MRWITPVALAIVAGSRSLCGEPPARQADPVELVRQLGDKRFAGRETAEQKLLALGPKAKAAVRAGGGDADPEVSRRCQYLLVQIRAAERDAFLAGKLDWPGPAGRKFRDLLGEGDDGRKLFAEVLKVGACCEVLDRLADAPDKAPTAYAAELGRVEQAWWAGKSNPGALALREQSERLVSPGEVVLLLLLDSLRKPEDAARRAGTFRVFAVSFANLARGPLQKPFRKLFLTWLERQKESGDLLDGMSAAIYAPIPEAVPIARRVLQQPKASVVAAGQAILLLGNHGTKEDAEQIGAFREDSRVYEHGLKANGENRDLLVRDIAAAMAVKLGGRDPGDFGFDVCKFSQWWSDSSPLGVVSFPTPEARDAAHKKAWAWLDAKAKRQ
jgi:hypothetical protein